VHLGFPAEEVLERVGQRAKQFQWAPQEK